MPIKPHDGTVGDMQRELGELREALAKANASIEANSNRDPAAPFADDVESLTTRLLPLVMDPVARGVLEDTQQGRSSSVRLARERDEARAALVEITHRYVDAEARAAAVPPEMVALYGQAAREAITKGTPLETAPLTEDQIRAAIAKGKADRARLEAAGWQHGLLPKRPPYCEGKCVNAPEGEPPHQRTFNAACAGCVREMDRAQEKAIDAKVREDFERFKSAFGRRPLTAAEAAAPALKPESIARFAIMDHGPAPMTPEEHDALAKAASDTADPAYREGEDNGVRATCLALVRVLGGPPDAVPCFGSADLTALAKRLLAMRAELDAVHGDLGRAVSAGALLQTMHEQLEGEVAALEAWVKGAGRLGDGRIAKAVLAYAADHEERVWAVAEERHRKVLEAIGAVALRGKAKLDAVSMETALDEVRDLTDKALRSR